MTATKPLDLAAFERSHAKEIEIDADAGALPIAQFRHIRAAEQYAALLAECKRQRIEFGNLSKAAELHQHISDGQRETIKALVEALRRTMQHAEHSTIEWIDD